MSCEPGCNHSHHGPKTGFGSWRPSEEDPLLTEGAYNQIKEVLNEAELTTEEPVEKSVEKMGKLIPLTRSMVEQLATLVVAMEEYTRRFQQQQKEIETLKLDRIAMRVQMAKKTRG